MSPSLVVGLSLKCGWPLGEAGGRSSLIDPPLNCKERGEIKKQGWREEGKREKERQGREEKEAREHFSEENV